MSRLVQNLRQLAKENELDSLSDSDILNLIFNHDEEPMALRPPDEAMIRAGGQEAVNLAARFRRQCAFYETEMIRAAAAMDEAREEVEAARKQLAATGKLIEHVGSNFNDLRVELGQFSILKASLDTVREQLPETTWRRIEALFSRLEGLNLPQSPVVQL